MFNAITKGNEMKTAHLMINTLSDKSETFDIRILDTGNNECVAIDIECPTSKEADELLELLARCNIERGEDGHRYY